MNRLCLLLSLACTLSLGCASDDPTEADAPTTELVGPRVVPPKGVAESCEATQEAARKLLEGAQRCERDSDCTVESVRGRCLFAFLCPVPVSRSADLGALAAEASSLSAAYVRSCGDRCPVARCASPEATHTFCNAETGRCDSRIVTSPAGDAAVAPEAPVDCD